MFLCSTSYKMATSSNIGPTQGPILLGKNYEFLSLRMQSFFQEKESWDPMDLVNVETDPIDLVSMTNQQRTAHAIHRNKENKAQFWIQNSVEDLIFPKITGDVT